MAKNKRDDDKDKETPAGAPPAPTEGADPAAARKLYEVTLPRVPSLVVEADSPEDAIRQFKRINNITATIHPWKVIEVTG